MVYCRAGTPPHPGGSRSSSHVRGRCFTDRVPSLVIPDATFTQAAIAVLVTLALALLLQAKLLVNPASHPISSRGRRRLVIFELYVTTVLSLDGIGLGYVLLQHLASDDRPFDVSDRRAIAFFLLLLLIGLALIAVVNRIVAVAWKTPERPFLEPELDDNLIYGLLVAILLAFVVAIVVLELVIANELFVAFLLILVFGLIAAIGGPFFASALDARVDGLVASRFAAKIRDSGYEASLADLALPGDLGKVRIKIYRSPDPALAEGLAYHEAIRLVRHLNGAWDHVRRADRHAETPATKLRLARTRDSRAVVVAEPRSGSERRRLRSRWTRQPPTGTPRGLVSWVAGHGVPPLPDRQAPVTR
jgi:hypothetical protein